MMHIRNEFKAGLFILIAVALFLGSILIIGREKQIFARQLTFQAGFKDVKGLGEGAPVRMGGLTVGRVETIEFAKDPNDPSVVVTLAIGEKFHPRIRKDAQVSIQTNGLLGDRFLSVEPGGAAEVLSEGEKIQAKDDEDLQGLMQRAKTIVQRIDDVAGNVKDITSTLKDRAVPQFVTSMESLDRFLAMVEKSDGMLKALVTDPKGKKVVQDLVHTVENISAAVSTFKDFGASLQNGDGLLQSLISKKPEVDINQLLVQFKEVVGNLQQASAALADGKGSIGALLQDPSLYDNLVEITDGAKRSFLLRQAIRQTLKK